MGYFHAVSPGRSSQLSSYRGRSSPSPHALHHRQSAAVHPGQGHSDFPISSRSLCGVIGGGGAFSISPQRQQRQYVPPHLSPQTVVNAHQAASVVQRAAPQDRQFRPIVQGRSPVHSPISRSSPSPQTKNKKRASVSPAENKKYKMELCKNFLKGGCSFGASCHFAHGPEELNRPDPTEMVRDGKLLYICEIWASTGAW
jgi:hypothetical protein